MNKKEMKNMEKEFLDEKKTANPIAKIFDIVLWLGLLSWGAVCLYDYYNVANNNNAKFCIKSETKTYEDGTVTTCTGLGYKAYYYNMKNQKGKDFGPFWIKSRMQ